MHRLLLSTSAVTIAVIAATPAFAQRQITTATTAPVATATANNGAAANIEITSAGSVKPTSGTAVTVNSTNNVSNAGTIQITDADNAIGIGVTAGGSGTITNTGTITIDENYTATDTDSDGDLDGPFAKGTNRFGIRTADGATFVGSIVNSGTITVEGNDSGGIRVGGTLQGSLTSSGTINVTGDRAVGIATGDVTGDVTVRGTVGAVGQGAIGVAIDGDVGGKLVLQGAIAATGYRYTTAPSDPSKLDADDLLQGGPAVRVAGNVAGGILLDIPPTDKDPNDVDEDKDGIPDASEGSASLASYGAAAALEIGAADDIAIGAVAGDAGGHGLVVKGGVASYGIYANINTVALSVGGKGGDVDLAGGANISGTVLSSSLASATAVRLGAGASGADMTVSGTVTARGGALATSQARAIEIQQGAALPKLVNSGTILATATDLGTATAIYDASGTLNLVQNTGAIAATASTGKAIALDLRANTSGVTIQQLAVTSGTAPSITGDVLLGSGSDVVSIADGTVSGTMNFGAGNNQLALSGDAIQSGSVVFGAGNDALSLTGTSKLSGSIDFGGGADTLNLASGTSFTGTLANSGGVSATIAGKFDTASTGTIALGTLNLAGTGVLGVTIDATGANATRYQVAGAATISQGADLLVHLTSVTSSLGTYKVLSAGSLTGGANLGLVDLNLPFLFKGSLAVDTAGTGVDLTVARKTASELTLNRSEAGAYDAIFAVIDKDKQVANTFLSISDAATLRYRFGQMLPEHAGGLFETTTQASRAAARIAQDPTSRLTKDGNWNMWVQQVAWGTSKDIDNTAAYDVGGWGVNGGLEHSLGDFGWVGASLGFYLGLDDDGTNDNSIETSQYEAAIHWRARYGGLALYARASAAHLSFDSTRRFDSTDPINTFSRVSTAGWNGKLYSATGSASYTLPVGKRLSLKPRVVADYYRMTEGGYTEAGGGEALNLIVEDRKSDEATVTGSLAVGYDFGSLDPHGTWMRFELEGGQRTIVGGTLGATTARFGTGPSFTLTPEARDDGWVGRARLTGGLERFSLGLELGAEENQGRAQIAGRLALQVGW